MHDRAGLYTITCLAFLVCAVAVAIILHLSLPPVSVPWSSAFWFVLFVTSFDLLAVSVSGGNKTVLTPSSAIHWAAPCIFGPVGGAVVCVSAALLGQTITGTAHYLARSMGLTASDAASQTLRPDSSATFGRGLVKRWIAGLGALWPQLDVRGRIESMALYLSTLALGACLAGWTYRFLGGEFLGQSDGQLLWVSQFILPYLALVAVSIVVEHGEYMIAISVAQPVPGTKGWYGFALRAKIALVEDVLPVWRGELFLVVVSLLMAYLYSQIGVAGLALAVMPVLALRDFFNQWIRTKEAYLDTITTLATYMQHYHPYTRGHLKRVAEMSERLARELRLSVDSIRHINTAGFLHDIGKIGVSEEILDKTAKLSDEEWERIKEHPVKGAEIISHLEFLEGIVDWIKYHHKWYNGAGYPATNGNGSSIPIEAAIIATADAFDAMTDDRELSLVWQCDSCGYAPNDGSRPAACPRCGVEKRRTYREPKPLDEAIDELRRGAGTQFHPKVVKAFLTMVERDGIRLNA